MEDTAMWADSKLRSIELSDKAKYFDRAGYPDTAKWTLSVAVGPAGDIVGDIGI
jgi:hypothetical protein